MSRAQRVGLGVMLIATFLLVIVQTSSTDAGWGANFVIALLLLAGFKQLINGGGGA